MPNKDKAIARISSARMRVSDLPNGIAGRTIQEALCHVEDMAHELRATLLAYQGLEGLLALHWHERQKNSLAVSPGELQQILAAFNDVTRRGMAALEAAIDLARGAAKSDPVSSCP